MTAPQQIGIHWLMSQAQTPTNYLGNALATIVMTKWEATLDAARMHGVLDASTQDKLESVSPPNG